MNVIECIKKRKSVRFYDGNAVKREHILQMIKSGICAPSGKNGQPWRFYVVQNDKTLLRKIAEQTIYFRSAVYADCLLLVFLDKAESYHYIKDVQAIGACIENMLLTAEELGIGACWNGQILCNDIKVKEILSIGKRYDLMAMIALGYPNGNAQPKSLRKPVEEVLLHYD